MASLSHTKKRSRRQRKKLKVREFQELGFPVELELKPETTSDVARTLIQALLSDVIEPNLLSFAGGENYGFVCGYRFTRKVQESDRAMIEAWLNARPEVARASVGALADCWHAEQPIYAP